MKIAYLILAHDHPNHLRRLVRAISSPSSVCFIHLDQKSKLEDFLPIASEDVVLTKQRLSVYWGDFTLVEATLMLMRQALADSRRFERFVLLSGTDYPLRSVTAIADFFQAHPTAEFINLIPITGEEHLTRLTDYSFRPQTPTVVYFWHKLLKKLAVAPILRAWAYKPMGQFVPYRGDQWWALSRAACMYILAFVQKKSGFVHYFKNTAFPDEMFFQIVLGNSPFKSNIRRNLTYVDWRIQGPHPAWLGETQLNALFDANLLFQPDDECGGGEILFARKFSDASTRLIETVDRLMGRE